MKAKFAAAAALLAALSSPAFAQDKGQAPAPATKAEVQKLVDAVKGDKAKLEAFCKAMKLDEEAAAASEKNDQKKVEELSKQMDEAGKKVSPDFDKIMSGLDENTSPLVEEVAKTCPK